MASEAVIPYVARRVQREIHAALEAYRFCVIVAHRRLGKTVCIIIHLILQALGCKLRNGRYAYIAPQRNQAKLIAWNYLKRFTAPIPNVKVNESELTVTLPNGAEIRLFGADNPDAIRGTYFDGAALDEVAQMKPEVWGEIVRPALADRNGFAVFIGTPKGMNVFHELYQRALVTEGWFARVWRAGETKVIPEAELAAVRAELSATQYRQEFLCDFSASSDDVLITIDLVDEAARRSIREDAIRGAERVIGIDVARFGSDRSALCRRQGLYCHPIQSWQGLANDELADRAAHIIREFDPDAVFIDAGGGQGVIDCLRRWGVPNVTEIHFGGAPGNDKKYWNKRAEMWVETRDWLKRGGCIPDDPDLKTDLSQPHYGYHDDNSRIKLESKDRIKARGGRSPDLADALALTFAKPVFPRSAIAMRDILAGYGHGDFGADDARYNPLA